MTSRIKKAQISITVILGFLAVFLVAMMFYLISRSYQAFYQDKSQESFTFSDVKTSIEEYVNLCIKDSVIDAIQDTGIREETVDEYKSIVRSKVHSCLTPILNSLRSQEYEIDEGEMTISVKLSSETITVDLSLPLVIEKNSQKITIKDFHNTFDRSVHMYVKDGMTINEITLTSSDGKAILKIPKGVSITDKEGKPVENIGIKVEDLHFDGLENKYVLGQTVYDNFPDGARFSQPIELTLEFREEDIPEGYTKDNIRIAWWNEEAGLWFAGETRVEGTRSISNITHFSRRADILGKMQVQKDRLLEQRFYPYSTAYPAGGGNTWVIGGKSEGNSGTATLKVPSDKAVVTSDANDFKKIFQKKVEAGEFLAVPKIQYGYYPGILDSESYGKACADDPKRFPPIAGDDCSKWKEWDFASDGNFIDCERYESKNTVDNIEYFLFPLDNPDDADNYPNFYINGCMPYSCSDKPEDYAPGNDQCKGVNYCRSFDGHNLCIPQKDGNILYLVQQQEPDLPCVPQFFEAYKKAQNEQSPKRVFGWHNYHCAGGRTKPQVEGASDETGASDLLIFEPNGNGVVFEWIERNVYNALSDAQDLPDIGVLALPADGMVPPKEKASDKAKQEYQNFIDALMVMQNKENIDLAKTIGFKEFDSNGEPVYYMDNEAGIISSNEFEVDSTEFKCDIMGSYFPVTLSDGADSKVKSKIVTTGYFGYALSRKSPAYGIKGINLIKKNHKDQLQAYCDVVWYFWGNGIVDYFPDMPIRST